jgi:predicted DNA-binding transcriptional regulator AlpA
MQPSQLQSMAERIGGRSCLIRSALFLVWFPFWRVGKMSFDFQWNVPRKNNRQKDQSGDEPAVRIYEPSNAKKKAAAGADDLAFCVNIALIQHAIGNVIDCPDADDPLRGLRLSFFVDRSDGFLAIRASSEGWVIGGLGLKKNAGKIRHAGYFRTAVTDKADRKWLLDNFLDWTPVSTDATHDGQSVYIVRPMPKKQPKQSPSVSSSAKSLLMTKSEVAHLLQCSTRQVENLVADGRLPLPIRIGTQSPRWHRQTVMEKLGLQ